MPSDSGANKRSNQNKKNKSSIGNIPDKVLVRDKTVSKSSPDELIHVQKDVQFGDNWCKIGVFFAISCALLGVGFYVWAESNSSSSSDKSSGTSLSWVEVLQRVSQFYNYFEEETVNEERSVETQVESSYLEFLWTYYPFGQGDEQRSKTLSETTEEDNEISKESVNEKDSRESDSKELASDKSEDIDDENDQDDRESEEDFDEEKKIHDDDDENEDDYQKDNDEDDEKDDDNDQKNIVDESDSAADNSENVYEPYKSSNYYSYKKHNTKDELQKDTKDDNESEESKEQVDRRDQRFNYYHNRGFEETHKYDYIKGEEVADDSSENAEIENFDSERNTEVKNDEDGKTLKDSSHSSEEVNQFSEESDEFPELSPSVEPEIPKEDDSPQSGNLVTKLSVGIALIFVAYSVIIRKWNHYANEAEVIFGVADRNNEDLVDIAQTIAENLLDSINNSDLYESSEAENKTLQDYLETPSNSANEQSEDDSTIEGATDRNLPIDSENSQTASETEDGETDEESDYEKSNYVRMNITNRDDYPYRHQLDEADDDWDNDNPFNASVKYSAILEQEPRSIRAEYGLVRFYDQKADDLQSNGLLLKVIQSYEKLLDKPHIPEALEKVIAKRTIERMKFMGRYDDSVRLLKMMIEKYPEEILFQIELAITYLILDKLLHAEILLGKVIQKEPRNGIALVNYGFIMKQKGELEKAAKVLSEGISTREKGTQDSKFYYHLGEALQRLGRRDEASEFYEKAVKQGIFMSKYQRSLYNVNGLNAEPWWNPAAIAEYKDFFRSLENNWKTIKDELEELLAKEKHSSFRDEAEQLREKGEWKQLELFSRGKELLTCKNFPFSCGLIRKFAPAAKCRRGQVKFSIMEPGTHVWPHCGPSNCRLRAHLGLIVPDNVTIRVAEETRTWSEGKVLLFDDSFEHEIWHNGTSSRLILIVDVWHPELSDSRRKILPSI